MWCMSILEQGCLGEGVEVASESRSRKQEWKKEQEVTFSKPPRLGLILGVNFM